MHENITLKKHNGINVPLFSIYSQNSSGIGEYSDLIPLISWCKEVSFDVIQLLPLNDTGLEKSPYSAISAFALNPIHLSLNNLNDINDHELQSIIAALKPYNHSKRCDYKAVLKLKETFLRRYYQLNGKKISSTNEFATFLIENPWLESYALFKTIRALENFKSFEEFPKKLQHPGFFSYSTLLKTHAKEINYHMFVQYLCFLEFEKVKKFAVDNQVLIMGDIPILINRDSADVWIEKDLFNLSYSAGAPPDMYSSEGQNWGFPTYNWKNIENEDYEWWKLRLTVASKLYDIYRIDHIVGFFRIWSIPFGKSAKESSYIPDNEQDGLIQGEKILRMMLNNSPMFPIGEDLGNVPDSVRACMKNLGIPGTKVMRWERVWNEDSRFIKPNDYPALSLTTVSTHDSENLNLWWRDKKEEAIAFAKSENLEYRDEMTKEQHLFILRESLHTASLFHINLLQEYLSLIKGFTSDNLDDERINVPGTVSDFNWTYKFQKPVEDIVQNEELKNILQTLLK